jgi:short-subunit dehydrogenase
LALEFARLGAQLLVTGRREDRLRTVAEEAAHLGSHVVWVAGDISAPTLRQRLVATACDELGGLDLLVNNAGVGSVGQFGRTDTEQVRWIMEVNFFAPAELIRVALPLLEQGRNPMIVNMGSVLGHCAVPFKAPYCASKFALHGLSDALRTELKPAGIDVLLVSPSTTATEFFQRLPSADGTVTRRRRAMSPQKVARRTALAIERGRRELILPLEAKLLVWCDRLLPGLLSWILGQTAAPTK